jgi:hypothetical protein
MDTSSLVKDEIDDWGRILEQLVRDGFDVTIAFWVRFKFEEDGPWFYIVSKTFDQKGLRAANLTVHAALHRIPAPWGPLSVSEIDELKLVGVDDPLAKEVLAFRDQYPGRNRFRRVSLGNQIVEELCIYPPVTKSEGADERGPMLTINMGTTAEPELIDLGKVPLVTIVRDSAGPSKVVLVGGGKPQRTLEGEEAQRFISQFDAIRKQLR